MMIKDLFTEKDGVSFCPVRAGFVIGFMFILFFGGFDLFTEEKHEFFSHAKDFMSGLAEYLGFGGAAVAGKNYTEKSDGN